MIRTLRDLRARPLSSLVQEQRGFYSRNRTPREIRDWQLEQFNQQWRVIRRQVPYFARLARDRTLPECFSSWQEFQDAMPVMDRKTVQDNREDLANPAREPDFYRTTGGSTGEPVQLPAWHSESLYANKDMWYARSWYGVSPSDTLFMIWGHSHLLGSGFSGWLNSRKRRLKDAFLGYYRYSAYDLSERGLRDAAGALLQFKPAYAIAYAVALARFARLNADQREDFHALGLRVAIATAESFPRVDSREFVADTLGCPVVMEYGAVETGPIAHQRPDGRYSVFWRHYFVEGCASQHVPGACEVLVTSLYPRCTPLVRYSLGDLISADPNAEHFNQTFESVIGRCNDTIVLNGGDVIHSEAFTHAVKESQSVTDFQVVQSRNGDIRFHYVGTVSVHSPEIEEVRRRLRRIDPRLGSAQIERVESLEQSIAGKTQRIIRETQ